MIRDLEWALRWLRKNPRFTATITLILALGIGANTAVFSIVDAVLLRARPYETSGRLVRVDETKTQRPISGVDAKDYLRWRERTDLFASSAGIQRDSLTVTGAGEPDQVVAQRVSPGLFAMLGVRAQLGRTLLASDERNSVNAAVLSDRLWRRMFHADPAAIGRSLTVDPDVYTVAGVMPPEFEFPDANTEMWVPLRLNAGSGGLMQVAALLEPGVPPDRARGALTIVAQQLQQEDPKGNAGLKFTVAPWRDEPARNYELTLLFILAAVGLVLLIACADTGGLLLGRAVERQKEMAIRASLGAGFWRVMRQLLAESLVLAVAGSAAGIALAHFALQFLVKRLAALPIVLPHMRGAALNGRVLAFNGALCLLLACLFSLAPVWLLFRTDLQAVLRGGQTGGGPRLSTRLFAILIACEAAFAFLLLVGSGLMVRSLIRLEQSDHGFHPDHVLTLRVPIGNMRGLPAGKYTTKPRQMAYLRDLVQRLERVPGIRAAAVVNNLPLSGVNTSIDFKGVDGQRRLLATRTISPRYFAAMGIPLLAGRAFTEGDQAGAPGVVIVNQYLARQLFGNRSPLGLPLPEDRPGPKPAVVGVVKDSAQMSYDQPAKGELYIPYQQYVFGAFMSTVVVRTSGDPLALANALRKAVWEVDANQPVVKVESMEDVVADSIWRPRFSAWVLSVLGGLALLLTATGVYGVVAYTTARRAREVGIRVALGARPAQVAALVLRDAMKPLAIGLALSLIAALMLSRWLGSLLYEIGASDPATYLGVAILLLGIGVAASLGPAWRAASGDPMQALRAE
ncbi:MAG: ABC transporter permease [Bryobacteraceae bacterium]